MLLKVQFLISSLSLAKDHKFTFNLLFCQSLKNNCCLIVEKFVNYLEGSNIDDLTTPFSENVEGVNCIKAFKMFTSMDTWGDRAEYLRTGLDIKTWEKNQDIYVQGAKSHITTMVTFNILSVTSFTDFLEKVLEWRAKYEDVIPNNLGSDEYVRKIRFDTPYLKEPLQYDMQILPKEQFLPYFDKSLKFIEEAKDAGFESLVLTVDTPVAGLRYRDNRNGLTVPPKIRLSTVLSIARKPIWWLNLFTTGKLEFAAFRGWDKPLSELAALIFDPSTDYEDIKWLRTVWDGPIVIKGIQSVADAKAVAKCGVQGIILSNHGGRQLDGAQSSINALPAIVEAVGSDIEVWMDGGIRSGQDVLKARALGARGTYIGRAFIHGLGAMGQQGVTRALEIIHKELDTTMALCGETKVKNLGRHNLLIPEDFEGRWQAA